MAIPGTAVPMKLVYKPFAIVLGLLSAQLSKKLFTFVWSKIDDYEAPTGTTKYTPMGKLVMAAAIQGVLFKLVRTGVDRGTAKGFEYLTGTWPGEKTTERADNNPLD